MKLQQVTDHCFAVLNETNRVCDANSGLINVGRGVVVDTQSDLAHARQMIELFGQVWSGMPGYVVLTHEDIDHVAGNQLFPDSEIIAHSSMLERMRPAADPTEYQKLLHGIDDPATTAMLETSITRCVPPRRFTSSRQRAMSSASGVVRVSPKLTPPISKPSVPSRAGTKPAPTSPCSTKKVVVVFPFVPVTPTTSTLRLGKP